MIKRKVLSIALCIALIAAYVPAVGFAAADEVGKPHGGTAPVISFAGTTTLYAAEKNTNTDGSVLGGGTVRNESPYYYISSSTTEAGEWWTYTVYVAASGSYKLEVLGSGGYAMSGQDVPGRFSLLIDGETITDGTGDNPVIMPANGENTDGENKQLHLFNDDDRVEIGSVALTAGEHVIKVVVDAPGNVYGMIFNKFYFTPVNTTLTDGTPHGGTAPEISSTQQTVINAAEKNTDANGSGGSVVNDGDYYDIRGKVAGEWWTYTVNVSNAGKYDLAVLGSSGYKNSVGRFSLTVDNETIVDGTGDSAVVLPQSGDGGFSEDTYEALYFFDDTDKTELGEVTLTAGEHVIKITVNEPSSDYIGIWFKKLYFTPIIEENPGTPYGGEALELAAKSKTTLYAARKNENATGNGVGGTVYDSLNNNNTVENNPENMDIRGKTASEWWTYTVKAPEGGAKYKLEVVGSSGYNTSTEEVAGRFTMKIGEQTIVDGNGQNPCIMPANGENTGDDAANKVWSKFDDRNKTVICEELELAEGEHVIKIIVDVPGETYGVMFKRFYFTPVGVELDAGTPYGGSALTIADGAKNVIYAALKNTGDGMGGTIKDSTGNNYTVESHPEYMDIRGTAPEEWWAYTIDVEKSGLFNLEILGSSGFSASSSQTDAGGRFTLKIDSDVIVDGTGENAVVLPAMGEGESNGSNKWWHDFDDVDKVNLGLVYLEEGTHDIKIIVDVPGNTHGILFKRMWLNSVPLIETIVMSDAVTIGKGAKKTLTYTLNPAKAQAQTVTWSSSDSSVCTVDENGEITGVGEGTATVTLSIFDGYQTVTKNCTVTVNVLAQSVSLSRTSLALVAGDTATVTASVLPADTTDKTVTWQSSNTVVAGVNNGVITARAAGTATIKAMCGDVYEALTVTVSSSSGGGGGTGGSGGGGGGGYKYLPAATQTDKAATVNNTYTVTGGQVQALDSKTMESILEANDTIKYNISTGSVNAAINGEFFTENPTSKSIVYSLEGGTVEIGADALNKAGVGDISEVKANIEITDSFVKVELTANGKAVSDLNDAVKVKFPADIRKDYTVTANGEQLPVEYSDNIMVFIPDGSGTYDISLSDASYTDADNIVWATQHIYTAIEKNILEPLDRGTFGADVSITRGEIVYAIVKALGLSADAGDGFADVPATDKYFNEITIAKNLGIVNGVDGSNFLPDAHITRQDMSVVIYNALKVKGGEMQQMTDVFSDDAEISGYARGAVYALAGAGFLKGRDTGFAPLANMTRAETAVLLSRVCGW